MQPTPKIQLLTPFYCHHFTSRYISEESMCLPRS
jgi:hypothetical protein